MLQVSDDFNQISQPVQNNTCGGGTTMFQKKI